ncbi:hypothetical protein XAPC_1546 [Xanthomonas citri pv. punicae str. LMG 859]|nr:hypothetical protein XAPC_1546 [Xanthomonas citri pv. punicae str. LMG 859]
MQFRRGSSGWRGGDSLLRFPISNFPFPAFKQQHSPTCGCWAGERSNPIPHSRFPIHGI